MRVKTRRPKQMTTSPSQNSQFKANYEPELQRTNPKENKLTQHTTPIAKFCVSFDANPRRQFKKRDQLGPGPTKGGAQHQK
jgi:hypothetical protein